MRYAKHAPSRTAAAIMAVALLLWGSHAEAFVYKILHSFHGREGTSPSGGLITDADGNLYGVTRSGGDKCGCGTVFKLTSKGQETVLYRFKGGRSGLTPNGRLARDTAGNMYGTTASGGSSTCGVATGCGTIFKLSPDGTHTVLHAFTDSANDGGSPKGDIILDGDGNLYGTAAGGPPSDCEYPSNCGTVYRLSPNRTMKILYAFQGGSDGNQPNGGLVRDDAGNLYGTTFYGGNSVCYPFGCGVIFELPVGGNEKILHAFDETDGISPDTPLVLDSSGNLYGGTYGLTATLYRLSPTGTLQTLFQFNFSDANGTFPIGTPLRDAQGDLFINNLYGGSSNNSDCGYYRCGTVFELSADGTGSALHQFGAWAQDGVSPLGDLVVAPNRLYGVTGSGGKYGEGAAWVLAL